jgi:outer membrane protein assembly factor BamB
LKDYCTDIVKCPCIAFDVAAGRRGFGEDRNMRFALWLTLVVAILGGSIARSDDWPCWRGAQGDGISRESGLLAKWPKNGPRQRWRSKLTGGFSSMAVADGRLFTMTKENNQEIVLCLDAASGQENWRYAYDCDYKAHPTLTGGYPPGKYLSGPRATPTVDAGRVYTIGSTGILLCLDCKTGREAWRVDLLKLAQRKCPPPGYCASPLVKGDRVYVQPGGENGKSAFALNKSNGRVIWHGLNDRIGHGTPVWIDYQGTPQVIFFTGEAAVGVSPENGKELWRFPWTTQHDLNVATPVYAEGKVFVSSNYGTGGAVFRVAESPKPETVWKRKTMQNHCATSVFFDGNLYGFSERRLRCVNFQTGDVQWDHSGLGLGTVLMADGKLIALSDKGDLYLLKAAPAAYEAISHFSVFPDRPLTWTVPVVSGGKLFVRSENEMVAFDIAGSASSATHGN